MPEIKFNLSIALGLLKKNDFANARKIYENILSLNPNNFDALFYLSVIFLNFKDYISASNLLKKVILLRPDYASAYNNLAICCENLNDPKNAIKNYNLAINKKKNFSEAHNNIGHFFHKRKLFDQAISSYKKAISYNKVYLEAYINLGHLFKEIKKFEEALENYDLAIKINPNIAEIYNNKGNILAEITKFEEALENYDLAIKIKPSIAGCYYNKGNVLSKIRKFEEALENYNLAIKINPNIAEVYNHKGNVLSKTKKFLEAIENYNLAIKINPNFAGFYFNKANVLKEIGKFEDAIHNYEKAQLLDNKIEFCKGNLLHAKMLCCNWSNLYELYNEIFNDVNNGKYSASPFGYQAICDDESNLQKCAQLFSNKNSPEIKNSFFIKKKLKKKKIKVGYLCGEFREQATSILMTEVWEKHNKEYFEILAFDSGWDDKSLRRKRIVNAFDKIIDISNLSDLDSAKSIYNEQVDILVNLNGFFGNARPIVFSYKPAKIQVNYLGFPGTMGVNYIDYIICDKIVVPPDSKNFYNEKIVYLPNTYQPNDSKRVISKRSFSREELSLPDNAFVFCCFNNNYKITPNMFEIWTTLLNKVNNSVLWLLEGNLEAVKNLKKEIEIRGIDSSRLIFAKQMKHEDHLARHRNADLFLDTLPYNAHTTASDSLWAGLPVLTCVGKTFPGRVGASLLKSLDLEELITHSDHEYINRAAELAFNKEKLILIKDRLNSNKLKKPLFNSELFCKNLEMAFQIMFEKSDLGLQNEDILV